MRAAGSQRTATGAAPGTSSLSSSSRFPVVSDHLKAQPREVPARTSEALDKPLAHRVGDARDDDGNRRGCLLQRGQHGPWGDNHVHLETDQLGHEVGEALRLALAPARLGHEMLAIHVAKLAQSALERVDPRAPGLGPDHFGGRPAGTEDADPMDLARKLARVTRGTARVVPRAKLPMKARRSISHPPPFAAGAIRPPLAATCWTLRRAPNATLSGRCASVASTRTAGAGSSTPYPTCPKCC